MSDRLSRRALLGGLLSGVALPVLAAAPTVSLRPLPRGTIPAPAPPPEISKIIADARLGGAVGFLAMDAKTGEVIEAHEPDRRLPPASVAKAVTAHYARTRLGPETVFETRLIATSPIENGRLDGDLILAGSGDPTLDTDTLGVLAEALRDTGLHTVTGTFRIYARALPQLPQIDPMQAPYVGYNPSIGGLNLNFNRVHFEWKRAKDGHDITMQARDVRFRPAVEVARMTIEDRRYPVFSYSSEGGRDNWTVAKAALGRDGARWLPVRRAGAYASDVFRTIARSYGIELKPGPDVEAPPAGTVIASHTSRPLDEMLGSMLRNSINLSAEAFGLAATKAGGMRPGSLIASAREMNRWVREEIGPRSSGFVDHSGLGAGSRVTARAMVDILAHAGHDGPLRGLMKKFGLGNDALAAGTQVQAKTGTLNFVSSLAGYVTTKDEREIIFAIFTADVERRDGIKPEESERPPGSSSWSRRSRALQRQLIRRWVALDRA